MIDLAFAIVLAASPTCDPPAGQMSGCQVIECPPSSDLVYSADGTPSCLAWADQRGDEESAPDRPDFTEVCNSDPAACPQLPGDVDIPAPPEPIAVPPAPIVDTAPPVVAAPAGTACDWSALVQRIRIFLDVIG